MGRKDDEAQRAKIETILQHHYPGVDIDQILGAVGQFGDDLVFVPERITAEAEQPEPEADPEPEAKQPEPEADPEPEAKITTNPMRKVEMPAVHGEQRSIAQQVGSRGGGSPKAGKLTEEAIAEMSSADFDKLAAQMAGWEG